MRLPTETDVVTQYAKSWGVLSPAYPQNGSGWFRARFIYAAFVGSILSTEKKEADQLGSPYRYPRQWVEQMNDSQLAQLAKDQRQALWPALGGESAFNLKLGSIIQQAMDTDREGCADGR
jgi:hypothetical protein